MLKTVIFDWDGTLVNSIDSIIECKQYLAQKYHLAIADQDTLKAVIGLPFSEALRASFPQADLPTLHSLAKAFHDTMQQEAFQARVSTETKALLNTLKQNHLNLAIATSKAAVELEVALRYNQLEHLFDVICCGDQYPGKPHPDMLIHIMQTLKNTPEECLMVGDTTIDVVFSQNAQVKIACTTWGAHTLEQLSALKPYRLFDQWNQLNTIIEELCSSKMAY